MHNKIFIPQYGAAIVLGLLALNVSAQPNNPPGKSVFVEVGMATHDTWSGSAGISWPWSWQADRPALSGHWDAYVSNWSASNSTGSRESLTQIALTPVLRWRFDGGRSAWFAEGGIGLSVTDSIYRNSNKEFSTRVNFVDHLGLGLNFGAKRAQELTLRIQHYSNADIKKPNPGENFLQLRYSCGF